MDYGTTATAGSATAAGTTALAYTGFGEVWMALMGLTLLLVGGAVVRLLPRKEA